jgi:hypothetical protein
VSAATIRKRRRRASDNLKHPGHLDVVLLMAHKRGASLLYIPPHAREKDGGCFEFVTVTGGVK